MLLRAEGLTKRFTGLTAVEGVGFHVDEAEAVGMIGPNGAGKTTVFNLLTGLLTPDSGRITFAGRDITGLPPHVICRMGMGRTFQITRPFTNLTVFETVTIGALPSSRSVAEAQARAEEVLTETGLWPKRDLRGNELTVPDLKRLELARALATSPRLLLLDEVVAGLNPTEVKEVVGVIDRVTKERNIAVLMVEHVLQAVMTISSRVIVLDHGKLIAEGPPSELAKDPRVIDAYLGEEYRFA